MAINRFGQYVKITVRDKNRKTVLETDSLRIDFDLRNIPGWVRGKISIYNLNPTTIRKLLSEETYVTITTALHDGKPQILIKDMFVSNAVDVINIPDNIVTLYGYSLLKKTVLEKRVNKQVKRPSVKNLIDTILDDTIFKGNVKYINFPDNYVEDVPLNLVSKQEGSIQSTLEDIGKYYRFHTYVDDEDITIVYAVNPKNAGTLKKAAPDIVLNSDNMRSNPIIGPAELNIDSNLDANIKPGSILSIKNLITASVNATAEQLELVEILDIIAGFDKYLTWQVQHIGSNYTGQWNTKAQALAPTRGNSAPMGNTWFK